MKISEAVLAEFAVLVEGPLPVGTDQQFDACVAELSEQDLVEALDMFDRLVNITVKEPEDENSELNPLRVEETAIQADGIPLPVLLPAEVPSGLECSVCGQQSRLAGRLLPCSSSPVCLQCCSRQDRCWECGQAPHALQWPGSRPDGEDVDRARAGKQEAKETNGIVNKDDESGIIEVEGGSPVWQQYKLGQNILAKYSEDGIWYNAAVLKMFPDGSAEVEYSDYGNTEIVVAEDMVWESADLPANCLTLLDQFVICPPDIQQPGGEGVEQMSEEEVGQVERKLEEVQLEPVQFNSFMYWREPIAHVEIIVETEWEAATGRVSFEKVNYVENVVKTSEKKMEREVEIELNVESEMNSDQMSKTVQFNSFMYWREPIVHIEVTEETEMEVGSGSLLTEKVNNVENVVRLWEEKMEEKVEIEVKVESEMKSEEIFQTKLRSRVQYVMAYDHGYLFHPTEEGIGLFFHRSQVIGGESLQPGDEVEFALWTGGREQEARSVRKLDSAQRPSRLLSQLKIRNNEELEKGGTRLLLRRQPKGPDGTKGIKILRQQTEVTRSDKVSDITLGRAKNEGKSEDIKRIPVARLKLDDVMRLQFLKEEVRGDKYYIWLAKFLQSAFIEGIEEVDDELFLTFKSAQNLHSLLRKYCKKPPANPTELRQLPVRAGFMLVQRCEYGLIVDVEENQNMPIKDVEQTLREVTENVKIRNHSSAFEAYFTELKNFLKILMHKDLSRFHSMTIMRESLVSMKECNGVKFCSGKPCFTERQLLQYSPDEVTAGLLSKFLKQQKAVDEVRLDWNGEVIVTYKKQSMKTMPSLPSSNKSSSIRFCASSSNQKYGVECLGDVDYRDFFQIDDNCVVHKEGAATVLCSPSRRFPFQCLTSRSLKALPCYSSLRLWRSNLVS